MNLQAIESSLKLHEGLRLKPYKCTANKLTIGYGRNIEDNGITKEEAEHLLQNDIFTCVEELNRAWPSWNMHPDDVQDVLVELVFNLGMPTLLKFQKTRALIDAGRYRVAADELLDSRWARQVGKRSQTLAEKLRNAK
jgi:lysozyme